MTIGIIASMLGAGTFAYFSDIETSTGNTFTAGTIDFSVDDQNPWNRENYEIAVDAKPCETYYDEVTIKNVGNNPMDVWKHIKNVVCGENGIIEPEQDYYDTHGIPYLKGYWRFEETTPWDDTSGEVKDNSSFENHGTASGAQHNTNGKVGQCAEFDGDDDYIEVDCGTGSSLNLENAVTIGAWVKSTTAGSYDYVIAKYYDGGKASYALDTDSAKARFYVTTDGVYHQVISNQDIWDGDWHHLVGSYDKDGGTGNLNLYIDGILASSGTTTGVMDVNSNMNFYIGNYGTGSSFSFPGLIDEVAVWGRALSESEIADLYGNPGVIDSGKNDIDTVILYDMWIEVDGVEGYDPAGGDIEIVGEWEEFHIDDIECYYIYLGVLPPDETMTIVQSYHMEADTGNWAQSDTMTFDIEFFAQQTSGNPPLPTPELPGHGKSD
jgi:predicted ribosomally synthesized peptide with SipW-like signal peptide